MFNEGTAIWSKEGLSCPQIIATEAKKLSIITSTPILNLLIICLSLNLFSDSVGTIHEPLLLHYKLNNPNFIVCSNKIPTFVF